MIYYWSAAVGLCWILMYGKPIQFIRDFLSKWVILKELFKCSLCLGFWSGVMLMPIVALLEGKLYALIFPLSSSAICWIADTCINFIQGLDKIYIEPKLQPNQDLYHRTVQSNDPKEV